MMSVKVTVKATAAPWSWYWNVKFLDDSV